MSVVRANTTTPEVAACSHTPCSPGFHAKLNPQGYELWQVIPDNKPFLWPAYLLSSNYGAQRAFLFPVPIVLCLKRWTGSRYILFLLDWQGLSNHSMNWSWKGPARPALGFPHSLRAVGGLSCVWVPTWHSECVGWSEGEEGSPADTDCPQRPVGKVGVSKATSASPLGGALNHFLNWNDLFLVDKNQEFGLVCWNKESRFAPVPCRTWPPCWCAWAGGAGLGVRACARRLLPLGCLRAEAICMHHGQCWILKHCGIGSRHPQLHAAAVWKRTGCLVLPTT